MQQSWRKDADKLTFIVCRLGEKVEQTTAVEAGLDDSPHAMIGDVNLFLSLDEDQALVTGELELMIAERGQQRKGSGRAALLSFLMYVLQHEAAIIRQYWKGHDGQHSPSRFAYFSAKIGKENSGSLALFESLGFRRTCEEPNYWGEYELRQAALTQETIARQMAESGSCRYTELEYKRRGL
jgi:DNA polymerase delta subunit 2